MGWSWRRALAWLGIYQWCWATWSGKHCPICAESLRTHCLKVYCCCLCLRQVEHKHAQPEQQ